MSSIYELIEQLRQHLQENHVILASPEDAAYFRNCALKTDKKTKATTPDPAPKENKQLPPYTPQQSKEKLEAAPSSDGKPENLVNEQTLIAPKPKEQPIVETLPAPSKSPAELFSSIRSIVMKTAPDLAILDEIPDDAIAKKIKTRWKTKNQSAPISILASHEIPLHKAFLEEIAIALDVFFGPARIVAAESIEKERQWDSFLASENLKLIIMCDSTLWQLEHLRKLYKETPAQSTRMLGNVPLFLLPDLSLYFKDPLLKRSLWKALCQKCS